ncbi:hypothetical protein, partial [Mesorhizobium sp.]|uniref:hypothetical protein n=1 Tax=Mesorhizobium sp. TaxID=1871066 RepID=UPI0025B7BB20
SSSSSLADTSMSTCGTCHASSLCRLIPGRLDTAALDKGSKLLAFGPETCSIFAVADPAARLPGGTGRLAAAIVSDNRPGLGEPPCLKA